MKRILIILPLVVGLLCLGSGFWIPIKAQLAQFLLQRAWVHSISTGQQKKPWPWADSWPIGRLRQQRLGVDLIILEGQSGEVLAFGPGHLSQSGAPGSNDHCILAGHRDTSFAFLQDLVIGDTVLLEGNKKAGTYKVAAMEVLPTDSLYFIRDAGGVLTLITCYPFDELIPGGKLRFVVTALLETDGAHG